VWLDQAIALSLPRHGDTEDATKLPNRAPTIAVLFTPASHAPTLRFATYGARRRGRHRGPAPHTDKHLRHSTDAIGKGNSNASFGSVATGGIAPRGRDKGHSGAPGGQNRWLRKPSFWLPGQGQKDGGIESEVITLIPLN
jgi:hypothetical protein